MLERWSSRITMSDLDHRLPRPVRRRREDRTVVVIADRASQVTRLQIPRSPWAAARVVPIVGRSLVELRDELAALSEVRLVVDVRTSSGKRQLEALRSGFFNLGRRDAWVALREPGQPRGSEPLVRFARRLRKPDARERLSPAWLPVARAVARVRITPDLVVLVKKQKHVLSVREDGALPLLASREPGLRVTPVAQLQGGVLEVGALSTDYGRTPELRVPDTLRYPVHSVRRYEGMVHLPTTSLVHHHRTVLPDSFRWHLTEEPHAKGLRNIDGHFGQLRQRPSGEILDGSYYLLLYNNPGHFGHLMTEALSKLWGWWPAKAADPSLKVLCRLHPIREETRETRLESTLLPAFGIAPDDIVWIDRPMTVTSLVGCTPMWHNAPPFYVHPDIVETWDRIRTGLIGAGPDSRASRIFVTRPRWNRPVTNVDEVERLFAAHGFTIVTPEALTVHEQAATFASARVVAGFGGAGMFNLMYAHGVEDVIVLNQWAYQARNEHLYAAAHGARLHTFWSPPHVDHPPDGSSYEAHQSGWTFDLETHRRPLGELLERLGD